MQATHHGQHRPVPRASGGQGLLDMPGHLRFPGQGAVGVQLVGAAIQARQLAVSRDPGQVFGPVATGGRYFEQVFPEFFMVATAQLAGQTLQVFAAAVMAFVEQRVLAGLGLGRRRLQGTLFGEIEVDKARRNALCGGSAQRHQLRRIITERVIGRPPRIGRCAAHGVGVDRQGHLRLGVHQQRQQRAEGLRPFHQHHARRVAGEQLLQLPGTAGAVVAHGEHNQLITDQALAQGAQAGTV